MSHEYNLVVRSYECDAYNHVNNSVYLNYLEQARVEMLLDDGINYYELFNQGIGVIISEVNIKYLRSALPGDQLVVHTQPQEHGASWGKVRQEVRRGSDLLVEAVTQWVCIDTKTGRPTRVPEIIKNSRLYK